MAWDEIMVGGRIDLIFLNGSLTFQQYLHTIVKHIVRLLASAVDPNLHSMHDNARRHVACMVSNWFN